MKVLFTYDHRSDTDALANLLHFIILIILDFAHLMRRTCEGDL